MMLLAVGCSDFDKFYREKKEASTHSGNGSIVIARVGREEITKEELIKSLNRLSVKQRIFYLSSPERMKDYLQSYVNQVLLYDEALKRGIGERRDIKEDLENYKRRLLIQALARGINNREFSKEEIETYYAENADHFVRFKISQIFIQLQPEKGMGRDEVRAEAEKIMERVNNGEEFEKLVSEFSVNPASKKKGGSFSYTGKGKLPVEVESEIFNLEEGEISNPIETESGFYIIRIVEAPKALPLSQVENKIRLELGRKVFSEYINELRKQKKVEIFEDKLQ
jgi:parvulin-like peptidyl-prolyl isomerase